MSLYLYPYPRRMARRWVNQPEQNHLNVNIREEEDAYILSALVPGLKADDLSIQVLDDVLSIEGEYKTDEAEYMLSELPSGPFTRTLRMPAPINADQVEAQINDGVLNLRLPKAESAKPKKIKIAVK
jgi:HSP20 family protein